MKKRILSLILAITMMLSLCCFTVGAENGDSYLDDGDWDDVQVSSVKKTDDKTIEVTFGNENVTFEDEDIVEIKLIDSVNATIASRYELSGAKLTITADDTLPDNFALVICDADEDDYVADGYVNAFTPVLAGNATVGGKDAFYAPTHARAPEGSNIYIEAASTDLITIARAQRVDATHYTLAFSEPVNLAFENVKVYANDALVATATDAKYIGGNAVFENEKWYSDFINITFDNEVPEEKYILKITDTAGSNNGYFEEAVLSGIEKNVKTTNTFGNDEIVLGSPDMEPGYTTLHTVHDAERLDTYADNTTPTELVPYTHPTVNWPTKESNPDNAVQILYAKVISKTQLQVEFSEPVKKAEPCNAWISIRYTNTSHALQSGKYLKPDTDKTGVLQEGISGSPVGDGKVWIFNYSDASTIFYGNNLYEVALCKGFEDKNYVPTFCIEDNRGNGDVINDRVDCFVSLDGTKYLAANNCNTNANEDYYVPITIDEASKVIPESKFTNFEQGLDGVTIEKVELFRSNQLLVTFSEAVTLHSSGIYAGVRYTTIGTDGNFALHNHKNLGNLQSGGSLVLVDEDTLASLDMSGTKVTESTKAIFTFSSFPGGRNLIETLNLKGFEFAGYTPLFDIEENGTATRKGYVEAIESVANPGTYLLANYVKSAGAWEDCYCPISEDMEEEKPFAETQDLELLGAEYYDDDHVKLIFSEKIQLIDSKSYSVKDNKLTEFKNGKVYVGIRYCDISTGKPNLISLGGTYCQPSLTNETDLLFVGVDEEGHASYLATLPNLGAALKGNVYAESLGVVSPNVYVCVEGYNYRDSAFANVNNRVGYIDAIVSEKEYNGKYKKLLATNGKQNSTGGYDDAFAPIIIPVTAAPITPESSKISIADKTISVTFANAVEAADDLVAKLVIGEDEVSSTQFSINGNVLTFTFGDGILNYSEDVACKLEIPSDKVWNALTEGILVSLDADGNYIVVNKKFKTGNPLANIYNVVFELAPVTIKSVALTDISAYELSYTIEFSEPMHIYDPNCIHVTFNQDPQGPKASAGTTDQLDLVDYEGYCTTDGVNCIDNWNKGSVVYENDTDADGFATTITFKFENKLLYTYQSTDGSPFAFYPENAGIRFEEWRDDFNNGKAESPYFGDGLICKESIRSLSGNSLKANCQNTNGCDIVWLPTQYWIENFATAQSFNYHNATSGKSAHFGDELENTITDDGIDAYKDYFDGAENYKIQVADVTPALEKAIVVGDKAVLLFNRPVDLADYEKLEEDAAGNSKLYIADKADVYEGGDVTVDTYTAEEVVEAKDAKLNEKTANITFSGLEKTVASDENEELGSTEEFLFTKLADGTYTIAVVIEEQTYYVDLDGFINGVLYYQQLEDAPSYYIVNLGTDAEPEYQIYSNDLTKVYYLDTTKKFSIKDSQPTVTSTASLKTSLIGKDLDDAATVVLDITSEPEVSITWGDVNGDTLVTIGDAVALIAYVKGGTELANPDAADVNGDTLVTIGDAVALIAYVKGGTPFARG